MTTLQNLRGAPIHFSTPLARLGVRLPHRQLDLLKFVQTTGLAKAITSATRALPAMRPLQFGPPLTLTVPPTEARER